MEPYLLQHLLSKSAQKHPERPAIIQEENTLTYAELDQQSSRLAAVLTRLGVVSGDRIGILLNKSPEAVVSIYGILKVGGIYVPLDPLAPAKRIAGILDRCDISVLIASERFSARILEEPGVHGIRAVILAPGGSLAFEGRICISWPEVLKTLPKPPADGFMTDTRPAYILHTSGSTGVPKGVVISHLNALTFVRMAADFFDIAPGDRMASHAPFHFDLSIFDLFVAAARGSGLVLVPDTLAIFPPRLASFIDKAGITVWNSVASVLSLLAERGRLDQYGFEALRLVLFSGDVLTAKHLRRTMERMPRAVFYNLYGQTEANSSTCYRVESPPADDRWKIPIGSPFPNFELLVLDQQNRPVDRPGEIGELYVGGATVALGYWRDSERTAASFIQNAIQPWPGRLYRTGDLVTRNDAGELIFLGRRDRQIKSRGYRIQIDEIDLALSSHPEVHEAATVDIPDEVLGARLIGFVRSSGNTTETDLLDFCSRFLPPYMIPEKFMFIEHFPLTATGKIDRQQLRDRSQTE